MSIVSNRVRIQQLYPYIFDPTLPCFLDCPKMEDREVAKKAFKKICPNNAVIVDVQGIQTNSKPGCIWRVYYEKKNVEYYNEEVGCNSNHPTPDLPNDEALLLQFFQDLSAKAGMLDLAVARKSLMVNTAIIDYYSRGCECEIQNFDSTTEVPQLSIKEAQVCLEKLKIVNH